MSSKKIYLNNTDNKENDNNNLQHQFREGSDLERARRLYDRWQLSQEFTDLETAYKLVTTEEKCTTQAAKDLRWDICIRYLVELLAAEKASIKPVEHLGVLGKIYDYYARCGNENMGKYAMKAYDAALDICKSSQEPKEKLHYGEMALLWIDRAIQHRPRWKALKGKKNEVTEILKRCEDQSQNAKLTQKQEKAVRWTQEQWDFSFDTFFDKFTRELMDQRSSHVSKELQVN